MRYQKPPVTETSLGLQFSPLSGWDLHIFGLYLNAVGDRYATYSSAAPIAALRGANPIAVSVLTPAVRGLYTSADGVNVAQLQNGFFFVNWRRVHGAEYSRYEALRERFEMEWTHLQKLLDERPEFERATPVRCFITYIDHADQQHFSAHDMMKRWDETLAPPAKSVTISASFERGADIEVGVTLQPALHITENRAVHQLTIEASKPYTADIAIGQQFDALHNEALALFDLITTTEAKEKWGKGAT